MNFIENAKKYKVIPVVALDDVEQALTLGRTLIDNGLPVIEVVLRKPGALKCIQALKAELPDLYLGVGTVINAKQAELAFEAGADFIVSPGLNPNTVKKCQELGIPIVPGVNNPSAIEMALELGLTNLKFFPAEASGGIAMIKALLAPYQDITLMPTGGVNPQNIHDYLSIDRVSCCGGTWFISNQLMDQNDWDTIAQNIQQAVELVK